MTEVYERDMNEEELSYLNSFLPSAKDKRNKFLLIFGLASIMPLMAFFAFLSYSNSISNIIIGLCLFLGISLAVTYIMYKNTTVVTGLDNYIDALKNKKVEVWIIKPLSVYKSLSTNNVPLSYYIKTIIDNKGYVIFMQGKYIDELEKTNLFPNSEFEITRTVQGNICLSHEILGQKINIRRVLPPFKYEEYIKGFTPDDFTIYEENEIDYL